MTPIGSAGAQQSPLVRIAITQNDKNWTPYTYQTGDPGYNVLTLLYDTLLGHDKDNDLIPWLAKDYKISADGRTVDVTIRDNVKWSDGQMLTADDVKFTYDYILQFNHGRFTPEVNGVLASTVVNGPDKVLALRAGEVDAMAANLAPGLVKELATVAGLNVLTGPGYTSSALTFNVFRPPFDSVRFRQAVGNAVDVDGLVAQVLQGAGVAGSPGYVHPDNPFYKKGLRHEFNLAKANPALDEIGYRN